MQYLGGKSRIAPKIAPVIAQEERSTLVEPFIGGAGAFNTLAPMFDRVEAFDIHEDLILMYQALQEGWEPPTEVSKDEYYLYKNSPPSPTRGFVGFGCSFGGKWFAGYAKNKKGDNYAARSARSLEKTASILRGHPNVSVERSDYRDIRVNDPESTVIYCDPPYEGTTKYSTSFDSSIFWEWAKERAKEGAVVYVSEYSGPPEFLVSTFQTRRSLNKSDNKRIASEKLFRIDNHSMEIK